MSYNQKAQKKYNAKMYFATAKLNPENPSEKLLIEKIEQHMQDKSLSRQAAVKELLQKALQ